MKKLLQPLAGLFGYNLAKIDPKSANSNSQSTLKRLLKGAADDPLIVFDVGAFQGQSLREFRSIFPTSIIYSFEPFPDSFAKLQAAQDGRSKCFNLGLLDVASKQKFFANKGSYTNSVLPLHNDAKRNWNDHAGLEFQEEIICEFTTLDQIVKQEGISRIDLLKLDVQGAEYRVIQGAKKSLESGLIDVVKCEVMLTDTYDGQKPLHYYLKLFDDLNFDLKNISDPVYHDNGDLINVDVIFRRR